MLRFGVAVAMGAVLLSGCAMLPKGTGLVSFRSDVAFLRKHLDVIVEYPEAFQGQGLTYADVVTYALSVLLLRLE